MCEYQWTLNQPWVDLWGREQTKRHSTLTWSSSPDTAITDASVGCHSIDVMGAECHLKVAHASGLPLWVGGDGVGEPQTTLQG